MAEVTKIQWTDHTFSPWRGCQKVSPGCAHCYAEVGAKRNPAVLGEWGPEGTRVIASESYWRQPLRWNREAEQAGVRRRVFCASIADVFEDRPELVAPRVRLFHLISETRWLDWLLLTKRPENIARFHGSESVARSWPETMPPNAWLGVSVEDQARADERIPLLLQTPARVRFLSVEPLLGPVYLDRLSDGKNGWIDCLGGVWGHGFSSDHEGDGEEGIPDGTTGDGVIDWVIIGGESGAHARGCNLYWIRSLVQQCKAAGVACFVKQLGRRPYCEAEPLPEPQSAESMMRHGEYDPEPFVYEQTDKKGGDPDEWPEDLRVREFPTAKGA